METKPNRRILVIDDNLAIHADFKKTLIDTAVETADFAGAEAALFDEEPAQVAPRAAPCEHELDFASQGREGYEKVIAARERGEPYALAFVDVRMPPGWDGIETIAKLWQVDAELQVVICTAFADYSWPEMVEKLGHTDRFLILKKPFDPIEVRQLASALTEKWNVSRREKAQLLATRAAEMEARAYAASLETLHQALETSRKAAEARSNAKSELLAALAQHLFMPVDALLDVAQELGELDGADVDAWHERVGNLCRDGGQLRRGLQDMVGLSELEAGTLRLDVAPFSLRQLAQDVLDGMRWKAGKRSLALELECSPALAPAIESDAARVSHILTHLLENAIEHTPAHGFVRIALSMRQTSAWDEPQCCVEVIDSGSGLTPAQESLLFEPFGNSGGDAPRNGHLGLGLCVSKRLAQRLGGDLTVESAGGSGCRFVLTLQTRAHATHDSSPPNRAA